MVAPAFFRHRRLARAEKDSGLPVRLTYMGLWGQADRRGIFEWREELQTEIIPYDDVNILDVLEVLAQHEFVIKYEIAGRLYGFIPSFTRWQHFHHREQESDAPYPPTDVWNRSGRTATASAMPGASPTASESVNGIQLSDLAPSDEQGEAQSRRKRLPPPPQPGMIVPAHARPRPIQ